MTSRDFCFWLQGFFELMDPKSMDEKQTDLVKRHLALVFKHEIDPSYGDQAHQDELNALHGAVDKEEFKKKLAGKLEKIKQSDTTEGSYAVYCGHERPLIRC
jgi:hypothetical protein